MILKFCPLSFSQFDCFVYSSRQAEPPQADLVAKHRAVSRAASSRGLDVPSRLGLQGPSREFRAVAFERRSKQLLLTKYRIKKKSASHHYVFQGTLWQVQNLVSFLKILLSMNDHSMGTRCTCSLFLFIRKSLQLGKAINMTGNVCMLCCAHATAVLLRLSRPLWTVCLFLLCP
jgi:hypothetical protein